MVTKLKHILSAKFEYAILPIDHDVEFIVGITLMELKHAVIYLGPPPGTGTPPSGSARGGGGGGPGLEPDMGGGGGGAEP